MSQPADEFGNSRTIIYEVQKANTGHDNKRVCERKSLRTLDYLTNAKLELKRVSPCNARVENGAIGKLSLQSEGKKDQDLFFFRMT